MLTPIVLICLDTSWSATVQVRLSAMDVTAPTMVMVESRPRTAPIDVHKLRLECVRPIVGVTPRRVRWLALLGLDKHRPRVALLAQRRLPRGCQRGPSWRAAMLARHHQSNNLVT